LDHAASSLASGRGNNRVLLGVLESKDTNEAEEVMSDKKQKATTSVPSRIEFPNVADRDLNAPEGEAVTMLDYEGQTVVTYRVAEKRAKPAQGAS
jgi:hypothetical protein